jgi:hypothetical protein
MTPVELAARCRGYAIRCLLIEKHQFNASDRVAQRGAPSSTTSGKSPIRITSGKHRSRLRFSRTEKRSELGLTNGPHCKS